MVSVSVCLSSVEGWILGLTRDYIPWDHRTQGRHQEVSAVGGGRWACTRRGVGLNSIHFLAPTSLHSPPLPMSLQVGNCLCSLPHLRPTHHRCLLDSGQRGHSQAECLLWAQSQECHSLRPLNCCAGEATHMQSFHDFSSRLHIAHCNHSHDYSKEQWSLACLYTLVHSLT